MKKIRHVILTLLCSISAAHAAPPLILSGPVPAVNSTINLGDTSSYTYTISNNTNRSIPVSQTITGNSESTSISTPCTVVPASGSCQFIVTIEPSAFDYLLPNGLENTVSVNYNGRLPAKVTSTLQTTVDIPALSTLTITPSAASYAGVPTTLGGGYVTYVATATTTTGVIIDITPVVTWSSTDETVALAPDINGKATTFFVGGAGASTDISATFGGVNSNVSTLQVNDRAYISTPVTSMGVLDQSPFLCQVVSAANGILGTCADATNTYSNITYAEINADARYIYQADKGSNSIHSCPLDASTGQPAADAFCTEIPVSSSGSKTGVIKLSPNNQVLYGLASNGIYACQVTQSTGALSGCTVQTNVQNRAQAESFAIDPNGLFMYILLDANRAPYVQTCSITPSTGTLSNCVTQNPTGINTTFRSRDITTFSDSGITYIYGSYFIPGGAWDGNVMVCQATASTGTINSCSYNAFPISNVSNPQGVSLTQRSAGPFQLYVADGQNGRVHNCEVGADFTTFSGCLAINTRANNAGVLVR